MNNVRYAAAAPLLTGAIAADDHSEVSMSIGRNGSNRRSGRGRVMASTILPLPIASGHLGYSRQCAFRTVGGDDLCGNRRQRVHRLRVCPSTRPKTTQGQRAGRHRDHLAGRLHALHTPVAGCGRWAGRRPIRHDSAGEHAARRAGGARQGGHGRFRGAHRDVHRSRTAIPHHVVGSPGVDAGFRHPPLRRARARRPRARVEVDRRGALSA